MRGGHANSFAATPPDLNSSLVQVPSSYNKKRAGLIEITSTGGARASTKREQAICFLAVLPGGKFGLVQAYSSCDTEANAGFAGPCDEATWRS